MNTTFGINTRQTTISRKPVVLIIDNKSHNLLLLRDILAHEGYKLRLATDAVCAFRSIDIDPPNLILLDMMMTDSDGHLICKQLKAKEKTRHIPLIFLSTIYDATDKANAFAMGGIDYIAKPFVAEEVITRVSTQLELSHMRCQLKQEITAHNHTQVALQQVSYRLEEHVRYRTVELVAANTKLKREIAKRKRVEQALSESEACYRNVVETQTEFVVRNTPDGVRTFVNSAFCRYWDIPPEEAIGKSFFDLLSPDELAHVQEKYDRLTPSTPTETHLQKTAGPNGQITWQEWTETGIFDEFGRLLEVQAIGRDVTEHKQAEQALTESEAWLKGIIDSAMDAIIVIGESQKIMLFNPTAEEIFGYTADEIIGQPVTKLIPKWLPQHDEGHVQNFEQASGPNRPMEHNVLYGLRKERQEFPIEASISKSAVNGELYYTVILRDITKQLALEEKFYQAQKMEAMGLLASKVAHDFNNLLTPIALYADLGIATLENENKAHQYFQQIQQTATRAKELTQQILAFSGKHKLVVEPLEINQVIIEISSLLRRAIGENIVLKINLQKDNPLVQADANQLGQVLMNLVINARDAMPDSGVLEIRTQVILLKTIQSGLPKSIPSGSYVLLSVSDTGIGMSEETQQRLFEPFYTTKEQNKGTGLGLATVYDIVQKHHGYLQFDSEPGAGTTFRVYFPTTYPLPMATKSEN